MDQEFYTIVNQLDSIEDTIRNKQGIKNTKIAVNTQRDGNLETTDPGNPENNRIRNKNIKTKREIQLGIALVLLVVILVLFILFLNEKGFGDAESGGVTGLSWG